MTAILLAPGSDPYVIITCEGEKVRSPVHKDTRCPKFDIKGVFYRKKPKEGIHIEVSVMLFCFLCLVSVPSVVSVPPPQQLLTVHSHLQMLLLHAAALFLFFIGLVIKKICFKFCQMVIYLCMTG